MKKLISLGVALLTASAMLFAPATAAVAAPPITDAVCTWDGVDGNDPTCSPITYTSWDAYTPPTTVGTVDKQMSVRANTAVEQYTGIPAITFSPNAIAPAGTSDSGLPYYVEPSDVSALPNTLYTGAEFYSNNHVSQSFNVVGFYGTVVGPDTWGNYSSLTAAVNGAIVSDKTTYPNPYAGLEGTYIQTVAEGTTFAVQSTEVSDGSYELAIPFATPTFTVETNGVVNAVGYVAALTAVVEDTATGELFTVSQQHLYYGFSYYSPDLKVAAPNLGECPTGAWDICVATGMFTFSVVGFYTNVSVPNPQPPVVEPPAVEPPAVQTPTPTPPVIQTGDENPYLIVFQWAVVALLGMAVFGVAGVFYSRRQ